MASNVSTESITLGLRTWLNLKESRPLPGETNRNEVNQRYKLTVYYGQTYGELYDLQEDPGEQNNLWTSAKHQDLKSQLLLEFLWGEMGKEPLWMPRIWGA